jgi:hypothetical protein
MTPRRFPDPWQAEASSPFDNALKEEVIRARLNHLGFDLEKEDFGYIVRDRREHLVPALQPTRRQDLNSVIDLFNIQL